MTSRTTMNSTMTSRSASASCANADASCANTVIVLDAITLASIIISLSNLGGSLVLAGLLGKEKVNDGPWARGIG